VVKLGVVAGGRQLCEGDVDVVGKFEEVKSLTYAGGENELSSDTM